MISTCPFTAVISLINPIYNLTRSELIVQLKLPLGTTT